jgi:hypothetical protein
VTAGIPRLRAEAAFGHLQRAASEVIAAAHDALDVLDDVVSSAEFGDICDTAGQLGRALVQRWASPMPPAPRPGAEAASETGRTTGSRRDSTVQHIAVR